MDIRALRRDLDGLRGASYCDPVTRGIYATDASHYQQMPLVVVEPVDRADCLAALAVARSHRLPVTARGGGTSLSGQTFGRGMVLDCSRHMDRILACDPAAGWARVEPGVVRDRLNQELARHGLHFAPDPATGNRATIGGMVGNNTSGTRSIVHGKTIDHVLGCTVALADGTVLDCGPHEAGSWQRMAAQDDREGQLYRQVGELIERHRQAIAERYPRVMRRVSGYNLDEFVDGAGYCGPIGPRAATLAGRRPWNLSNLIVGSEGTLGLLLDVTIRLTPLPGATALAVIHFDDELAALRAVPQINAHAPSAVELLDRVVCDEARINPATRELADFIEGRPAALLLVEISDDDATAASERIDALVAELQAAGIGSAWPVRRDPAAQARVWEVRKLGLGLISNVPGPVKGQAFVEDACVPVEQLADYIAGLQELCAAEGLRHSMYAHASVGVIHFRPMLDLHLPDHRARMQRVAEAAFQRCQALGGSFAGEHGDGIVRGQFIPEAFGAELYGAFQELKRIFDPDNLMNPGKVIDTPAMTDPAILRYGSAYRPAELTTRFHYRDQGGITLAVEQCNGVGACRKVGSGTMCPSYMATRREADSTRGRANALRLALSGQLAADAEAALTDDGLAAVLELCLSCKACVSECPNSVDLARLKAEVSQRRHDRYGVPLGARLIGGLPDHLPWLASPLGRLGDRLLGLPGARRLLQAATGIDHRRPLPRPARQPLHRFPAPTPGTGERVLLFADTYARWYEPDVALAAERLLTAAGFAVERVHPGCCQRPRLSQGLVDEAVRLGGATMRALDRLGDGRAPIICLEPSCASALAHDLPDLLPDAACGRRVADRIVLLDRFLADRRIPLRSTQPHLAVHTHCHQQALFGRDGLAPAGADRQVIDAGCCGMAGGFGYQHYDVSLQVAGDRFLPAVTAAAAAGATIVADGISCRHQLADLTGLRARHWAEVVELADPPPGATR